MDGGWKFLPKIESLDVQSQNRDIIKLSRSLGSKSTYVYEALLLYWMGS